MREYQYPFLFKYKYENNKKDNFLLKLPSLKNVHAVIKYEAPFYNVIFPSSCQFQGWKIHLSPILTDYSEVLLETIKLLIPRKISFKFVPNLHDYQFMSDKNVMPSQFGKYITIYPDNFYQFKNLLEKLSNIFVDKKGVRVPSDKNYNNIVNYRYGGFFPRIYMDEEANLTYDIIDGKGKLIPDKRKTYFTLPEGITDPFISENLNHNDKEKSVSVIGVESKHRFLINGIIRRLGTGNVYQGIDLNSKKNIIIKESRYGSLPDWQEPENRNINLKKNELKILKQHVLTNDVLTPKYIDYFKNEDSFFLVEELINGKSIRDILPINPMLKNVSAQEKKKLNTSIISIWKQILCIVSKIHNLGYVLNDISDDNFLVDKNNKVYLVDLETISKLKDNKYGKIGTQVFSLNMPDNLDNINSDYYKLALMMYKFIFGRINEFAFDKDFFQKEKNILWGKMLDSQKKVVLIADQIYSLSRVNTFTTENTYQIMKKIWNTKNKLKRRYMLSDDSISKILNKLSQRYKNNPNLKSTKYLGERSNYTLAYGKLGSLIVLKKLGWINEKILEKNYLEIQSKIIEFDQKGQLNNGLFFGLAGDTIYEFEMDSPYEKNYSLNKLLFNLKVTFPRSLNLANGLSGIIIALMLISNKKGYPNFNELIVKMLQKLEKDYEISSIEDEGLEYGSLGIAFVFLKAYEKFRNNKYLKFSWKIIASCMKEYGDDKYFEGISYNKNKWPNIRSPYLMAGRAGFLLILLEYYKSTNQPNFNLIDKYLNSLNLPFTYNYGINYGAAGILMVLHEMLKLSELPKVMYEKILQMEKTLCKFVKIHFHENIRGKEGWLTDSQTSFSDDIGSGSLGIAWVLAMIKGDFIDEA